MKKVIALGILLAMLGCNTRPKAHDAKDHTDHHGQHQGSSDHRHSTQAGGELAVRTEPGDPTAARPVTLKLMIHAADGMMVKDFEKIHDEKAHLVIVRDGLDHFAHIHPAIDAQGNLTISHTFPVGGKYRLFADYKPTGGKDSTAIGSVSIGGNSRTASALVANAPGEVVADSVRATISAAPLKVGEPAHVTFAVQDDADRSARLEPYMGAFGHLMFLSAAGQYVHVHPVAEDAQKGRVNFEAHFSEPGLYKGWGQFKIAGKVRVVPFVVNVQ